jgi:hypothetical protein
MRKFALAAVAGLTFISGCTTVSILDNPLRGLKPQLTELVTSNGERFLVLDQDPIVITSEFLLAGKETAVIGNRSFTGVPIVWTISEKSPWRFSAEDGIKFLAPPAIALEDLAYLQKLFAGFVNFSDIAATTDPSGRIAGCRPVDEKLLSYKCLVNIPDKQKARFKYSIHLINKDTGEERTIDPNAMS